jgi:hypothetical protein
VILELQKCRSVELGVAHNVTRGIDEGYAMTGGGTRFIGKRISVDAGAPLHG